MASRGRAPKPQRNGAGEPHRIFAALVDNSSDFIGIAGPDGKPIYLNPAGRRMVGLGPDYPVADTRIPDYYTPDQRAFAAEVIVKQMVERGHWKGETSFRNWQTGDAIPVSDEHFMIRDPESGRVLGMGTITRDISDLKRARDLLDEAQALAHVGSWELDLSTKALSWSAETYRIFGIDPATFGASYEAFLQRLHPGDRDRVHRAYTESLRDGTLYSIEHRVVMPDGGVRHVQERCRTFYDAAGKPVRSVGTVQDITERKRAEESMRQAAAVFAAANDAIIVADARGRITSVNPAFTRITGHAAEEVVGQNPRMWSSGRHDDEFYERMWSELQATGQWRGEIWNRRKSGEIYPAWQNISALRAPDGEVTGYVSIFSDISDIKATQARLAHLAHHDMLTGLANRALFTANLDTALQRAKRRRERVGMLVLDLDRFKMVNDTLGHAAGDRMLKEAAGRLQRCVRAEDTVARLGGDEFGIIVSELAQPHDAAAIAAKILAAIGQPIVIDGKEVRTSASVGIALFPDDARSGVDLVKAADAAMYRAKTRGRDTFDFYTTDLSASAAEYLALETGLRAALARGELVLHYQPQAEIGSGRIVGVEALVRWRHPERGLLLPDRFIHVAEESGLIVPIGDWVLNTALEQVGRWVRAGVSLRRLAVNVSAREILHGHVANTVAAAIVRHDWPQAGVQLELEITESMLLSFERGADVFQRLKGRGVMIAIDDFGTGYSSLSRLQNLPVDTLKIDRSFVSGLPADGSRAIATAIIAMAHGLGLRVIAEGVETAEQLEMLRALGCDEVQGLAVSAPVAADAIPALVRAHRAGCGT